MRKTVIEGNIEFLNRSVIIHSIDEVYRPTSEEGLKAILSMIQDSSKDWLLVDDYVGEIRVTKDFLFSMINRIKK